MYCKDCVEQKRSSAYTTRALILRQWVIFNQLCENSNMECNKM